MAGIATDSFVYMNAVIEVNEIGEIIYASPLQGFTGSETRPNRFQERTIHPDLRMTVHARFRGWNAGKTGSLYCRVAVAAINPHSPNVMRMTELDRLFAGHFCLRYIWRAVDLGSNPGQPCDNE